MDILKKISIIFKNFISQIRFLLSQRHTSHRIALSIIHSGILVWACIVSFTYSGCLESALLCPQAYFTLPFTDFRFFIYSELPLTATAIILSTVNITAMFAIGLVKRFNYILAIISLAIFFFSIFFVTSYVRFGQALQQEINRIIQSGQTINQ